VWPKFTIYNKFLALGEEGVVDIDKQSQNFMMPPLKETLSIDAIPKLCLPVLCCFLKFLKILKQNNDVKTGLYAIMSSNDKTFLFNVTSPNL
jgi:hypothetical protein